MLQYLLTTLKLGALVFIVVGLVVGTATEADQADAAFPGKNGKIAFQRSGEIYTMNPDGSDQTNLTNQGAADQGAMWSSDGKKIAFASSKDGDLEIYVMNMDGTSKANVTKNGSIDDFPAWSPDGNRVAFHTNRDSGDFEVYVMNADGTGQTNWTNSAGTDSFPAWSPDGSKIAFISERDGNREVYVMNADCTNPTNLSQNTAPGRFARVVSGCIADRFPHRSGRRVRSLRDERRW